VRIFEYQRAMLHAKALVVDSSWCTVGSLNLDSRSLRHNMELNLTTCDIDVARQLSSIFIADLDDAREVELAEWRRRGIRTRLRETMVKALRAWL
ncbi:MAG TPA: phospholipase D-like domain-containing protein, partial [Thermoanaerobaculia bacterium]|nr:phospholipase D-like domain-containing protein [Thermoanaerobaculia bacterium]